MCIRPGWVPVRIRRWETTKEENMKNTYMGDEILLIFTSQKGTPMDIFNLPFYLSPLTHFRSS